jgi:hypothetical protein
MILLSTVTCENNNKIISLGDLEIKKVNRSQKSF